MTMTVICPKGWSTRIPPAAGRTAATADGEIEQSGAPVTDGWTVGLPTYQEYNDARDAARRR